MNVWNIALFVSIILATVCRLPSIIGDLGRQQRVAARQTTRKDSAKPFIAWLQKRPDILDPKSPLTPSDGLPLKMVGRPLVIDRRSSEISQLQTTPTEWAKPMIGDEPLTLIVLDQRQPVSYPDWFVQQEVAPSTNPLQPGAPIGPEKKVAGEGERGDVFVVQYPQGKLLAHFLLEAEPPPMILPVVRNKNEGVATLPKGQIEFAFDTWFSRSFGEGWSELCSRMQATEREDEPEVRKQKSIAAAFFDSPLDELDVAPTLNQAIGLHLNKFFWTWVVVAILVFGIVGIYDHATKGSSKA